MLTIGLWSWRSFVPRNLRATIIPSVAVPLSLVGTFGVMYWLGFSLNNLTLRRSRSRPASSLMTQS